MARTRAYRAPRRSQNGLTELRKQYGTNLPPSLRWNLEARSPSPPPRRVCRERSQSPSPPPRNSVGLRLFREDERTDLFKVQKDEILIDTLTWYNIPWEYEGPDTIVLLQELDRWEVDMLRQHTKHLRNGTLKGWDLEDYAIPTQRLIDMDLLSSSDESDDDDDADAVLENAATLKGATSTDTAPNEKAKQQVLPTDRISGLSRLSEPSPLLVALPALDSGGTSKDQANKLLKLATVPLMDSRAHSGLFYSLHIQQPVVNYDVFTTAIVEIPQLVDVKDKILEHFTHAWSQTITKPWKGKNRRCKHKSGVNIAEAKKTDDGKRPYIAGKSWYVANDSEAHYTRNGDFEMISICVPFSHLGELGTVGGTAESSENDVPSHTLFQSLNRNGNKQRDLKQVICRMVDQDDPRPQLVSPLWAFTINNELLVTCSPLSREELYGTLLVDGPSSVGSAIPKDGPADIHIRTPDGGLWLLKRSECTTYLELVSHLLRISQNIAKRLVVRYKGETILPHKWADFIQENTDQILHLELVQSKEQSFAQEPPSMFSSIANRNFQQIDDSHARENEALGPSEIVTLIKEKFLVPKKGQTVRNAVSPSSEPHPAERMMSFEIVDSDVDGTMVTEPTEMLHRDRIYQQCIEVAPDIFNQKLSDFMANHLQALSPVSGANYSLPSKETVDKLAQVLSLAYPFSPEADGTMMANLLDGLQALLKLFSGGYTDEKMEELYSKILGATHKLITTFALQLVLQTPLAARLSLQACLEKDGVLQPLFERLRELQMYPFILPNSFEGRSEKFAKSVRMFAEQIVAGFNVAASLVTGLTELLSDDIVKQFEDESSEKVSNLARLMSRACDDLSYINDELNGLDKTTNSTQSEHSEALKRACGKLARNDFDDHILMRVLRNRLGWRRVSLHCDRAKLHLNRAFELECERYDPAIRAPQPADLLAELLQRVFHLPMLDGEGAMYMYNRYMTELESDLLLEDDPPAGRLRHLEHELTAISQLQQKQMIVLEGFTQCLDESEDYLKSRSNAYRNFVTPTARICANRNMEKLRVEMNNVNALEALIERHLQGKRLRVNVNDEHDYD